MKRAFEITGLCIGWFAIIAQFVLMLQNRQAEVPETIVRFFSFFTILTNLLVALFFTGQIFRSKRFPFGLLSSAGAITAITAFILIVGLVYQVVLRSIWEPTGLQYVVDELLHTVIPLFMLGYWYFNMTKSDLQLNTLLKWLAYPLTYIVFIGIRGHFSGYYPYPFLSIDAIGIDNAAVNAALILALTVAILFGLSLAGTYLVRKRQ